MVKWAIAAAVLLAGCLAPGQPSVAHPECVGLVHAATGMAPGTWGNLSDAPRPADPGWPVPDGWAPGLGANVTRIVWRPDGRDALGDDLTTISQADGHYTGPVIYTLAWPLAGDALGPSATATYDHAVPSSQVMADAQAFLAAVAYGGDRTAWARAFVANVSDADLGLGVSGPAGAGPTGPPAGHQYRLAWDEATTGAHVVFMASHGNVTGAGWTARGVAWHGLGAFVSFPARSYWLREHQASTWFELDSAGHLDVQVTTPAQVPEVNATSLAWSELGRAGIHPQSLQWAKEWDGSWCDPDSGLQPEERLPS